MTKRKEKSGKKKTFTGRFPTDLTVRCEAELKTHLKDIADKHRLDASTFVRGKLWQIVEQEEKASA